MDEETDVMAQRPKLGLGPLIEALKVLPLESDREHFGVVRFLVTGHTLSDNLPDMTDTCRDTTKHVAKRLRMVSLRAMDRTMRDYLGDAINARRKQLDLSQEELAERIGCSSKTLGRWEAGGEKDADGKAFVRLEEIAPALETTPAKLLSMALGLAGDRPDLQPGSGDLTEVLNELVAGNVQLKAQLAAMQIELEEIGKTVKR